MKARTIVELDQDDLVAAISNYIQDESGQMVDELAIKNELTAIDLTGLTLDINTEEASESKEDKPVKKRKRRTKAEIEADEAKAKAEAEAAKQPEEEVTEESEPEIADEDDVPFEADLPKEEVNEEEAKKPVSQAKSLFN